MNVKQVIEHLQKMPQDLPFCHNVSTGDPEEIGFKEIESSYLQVEKVLNRDTGKEVELLVLYIPELDEENC